MNNELQCNECGRYDDLNARGECELCAYDRELKESEKAELERIQAEVEAETH